jgi:isopentenyl diphosphate isomerase/L-lactate dehydrogenase-like FMN-dependent dehydrogenase
MLKAYRAGGYDGALAFLQRLIHTVRSVMLLTGSHTAPTLQRAPTILGPTLARWALSPPTPPERRATRATAVCSRVP